MHGTSDKGVTESSNLRSSDPDMIAYGQQLVDCARRADAFALDVMLRKGVDVNTCDHLGMTALHHAAAIGSRACIRLLVNCGKCDYLIRDRQGRYASDLAIEWGRDYVVGRLLSKKQAMQAHRQGVPAWQKPDR